MCFLLHSWLHFKENDLDIKICRKCYKKVYIRNGKKFIRKASISDIRDIDIINILKNEDKN